PARRAAIATRRSPSPPAPCRSRRSKAAPTRSPRRRRRSTSSAASASSRPAMAALSPAARASALAALPTADLDLLVIGGGITGAGVARDAALRGLSVALLEAVDFAAGTSSRSSKPVHRGGRLLPQGEPGAVRRAAHGRARTR